jgi:malic enzyme
MLIPVFHDDQHGTAIIIAAGLLNALEIQGKMPENAMLNINISKFFKQNRLTLHHWF